MKINRNNYELYFMDYLDGNLSDRDIQMLEDFLLINPDLRTELEGTEKISLSPDNIVFDQKEFLKKPDLSLPVNENNFEDFCIALSEGDLDENQSLALDKYTSEHQDAEKQLILFTRLHLSPDENIIFPGKQNLKKTIIFIPREILYPVLSVAAAIAFMLVIYIKNDGGYNNLQQIAGDLPTTSINKPAIDEKVVNEEKPVIKEKIPVIQQASVISLNSPKEKKQAPVVKEREIQKKDIDNRDKDNAPTQRLNPSFQIKLPSLADNQVLVPSIERGKVTYTQINESAKPEEFLSLSEYARKQLSEKVLGNNDPENTKITGWQIADAGLSGINKITGGDMKLEKKTSLDGNLTAYSFNSKLLSFSRTTSK